MKCIFCGKGDVVIEDADWENPDESAYQALCANCRASGPEHTAIDAAKEQWLGILGLQARVNELKTLLRDLATELDWWDWDIAGSEDPALYELERRVKEALK